MTLTGTITWCAWGLLGLGIMLLVAAARGQRKGPSVTYCRRCRYDLSGLAEDGPCPECGSVGSRVTGRVRLRRWVGREGVALAAALALLGGFFTRSLWVRPVAQWCWDRLPKWRLEKELWFDGLRLRRYAERGELDMWGLSHKLKARGKSGGWVTIVESEYRVKLEGDESGIDDISPIDLTGDGVPEHFVSTWSGGAHCCSRLYVFDTTSNGPLPLAAIPGEHTEYFDLSDADGDGLADIRFGDWHFAYWKTSFSGSPAPEVILTLKGGVLRPLVRAMRRPPPSDEELELEAAEYRRGVIENADGHNSDLWRRMLDLMYQGNEPAAWRFFELAWFGPASSPGSAAIVDGKPLAKEQFRAEFIENLNGSKWWPLIKAEYEREASPSPAPSSLPSPPLP